MVPNDINRISATIRDFATSLTVSDLGLLMSIWHPEARIHYVTNGTLSSASLSLLEELYRQQAALGRIANYRIALIDCTGSVAVAKVEFSVSDSQSITKYTDYLILMKFSDEKWLITSKSFHAQRSKSGVD
ncbi:MAG: hypothetical protein EAX95_10935 [Candidatus Thorarchaeota archaeon]|nr:hypothetical protein [Candidatus Thorarchaeota archaeon]